MVRILLRFPEKIVNQPIISHVILQHGIPLNIIAAHVDFHGGQVLVDVPSTDVKKVVNAFKEKGVVVTIPKLIEVDEEKCLHCGACYSLCPVGAITFKEDFSVFFDMERCIGSPCGLCVDACPAKAIKLAKGQEFVAFKNENKKSL
ncbi:MAG: 4Fe-4S dicluster domain-containing protein [Nitrososphaerota archaeon]|nr:4Fe-4S dicluster domain-containing protein [Candidatus Bathyarchaeota archaeon]MDW8022318.1 4Fe-4S dicluster domain-containing protein [Nitrososphaerota archaeon]